MTEDEVRKEIVGLTIKEFYEKPFVWGSRDCSALASYALTGLGYKIDRAKFGLYGDALGSFRALRRCGFYSTQDVVDDVLGQERRIDPQFAEPADIVALGLGDGHYNTAGLCVALGQGVVLGFAEDMVCRFLRPNWDIPGATYIGWRASPQR